MRLTKILILPFILFYLSGTEAAVAPCSSESRCLKSFSTCIPDKGKTREDGTYQYLFSFNALFQEKVLCVAPSGKKLASTRTVSERVQNDFYNSSRTGAARDCLVRQRNIEELFGACE